MLISCDKSVDVGTNRTPESCFLRSAAKLEDIAPYTRLEKQGQVDNHETHEMYLKN